MMLCVHSQEKNKKQNKENKKQNLDDKNQNQKSLKENMKIKCLVDTITNTIFKVHHLCLSRYSLHIDR